jgi:predicted FMN-binding regulatory protein PaiB
MMNWVIWPNVCDLGNMVSVKAVEKNKTSIPSALAERALPARVILTAHVATFSAIKTCNPDCKKCVCLFLAAIGATFNL